SLTRILSDQTARTFDSVAVSMRGVRASISGEPGPQIELDGEPVRFLLEMRSAGLDQVESLFVVDRDGFGVNSSRPDFIGRLPMARHEFFRYFADGGDDEMFVSHPEQARAGGKWTFYVGMRLLDQAGRFRGVLVASMKIDYFEALYENIELDLVGRVLLLGSNGFLLASNPHSERDYGKEDEYRNTLTALRAKADGFLEVDDVGHESMRLATYRQVPRYPLAIGASVDEEGALTHWRQVRRTIIAGVALVLVSLWTTTGLIARNLLRSGMLESALKESDEQVRHMVQSVKDAIVTVNSGRDIVVFNAAAEQMFGTRADAVVGQSVEDVFSPCMAPAHLAELMRHLKSGWTAPSGPDHLANFDLRVNQRDFPVELSLSMTTVHGEALLTAVFRDLTESRRYELELLETNRQLQALFASLQTVREEQRARISRELHDELGQLLTGIRMEVSWLGRRLPNDPPLLGNKVASIKDQIDQTIASVRRISSELRPLVLDDLGFAAAANWYVDQFSERTGALVVVELHAVDPEGGSVEATVLFRVLQESLTNIARHARASRVDVKLIQEAGEWVLSIEDDGVGFTYDRRKQGDIGLAGMRERALAVGGRFALTTSPGRGTLIEIRIPVKDNSEGSHDDDGQA
ncbi:MAG: histidine kinase, partial [Propionivibrio sp.]